jgi:hypothetical protein
MNHTVRLLNSKTYCLIPNVLEENYRLVNTQTHILYIYIYVHTHTHTHTHTHKVVSKSFGTGHLERELQMVQISATRCSCIAILLVSLMRFAAITLCVASERVFIVVSFVIDSVRKLLDTPSYLSKFNFFSDEYFNKQRFNEIR